MSEPTKQNPVTSVKNFIVKNERKILLTTTVLSTTAAVVLKTSLVKHDEFLKEHGLFDKFYAVNEEV